MGGMFYQAGQLSGKVLVAKQVCFRHAPQADLANYSEFFGIEPTFGSAADSLSFNDEDLQQKLPQADSELYQMHCDMAEQQLALLPDTHCVSSFAVQWLASTIQQGRLNNLDELARVMGISIRTLQRLFKQEHTTWTAVVDQARCEALKVLLQQGATLEVAAQRIGYHDASSLSRAAQRWFGKTAGQWRVQLHQ